MTDEVFREQRRTAEAELLRALCSGGLAGPGRQQALERLADYRFSDAIHQAVFDALCEMPAAAPDFIRLELPARLTRKGFPDADFDTLFTPAESSLAEVVDQLLALGGGRRA